MEKCEHGLKITQFCIYQYCAAKQAAGCEKCIKKYHSHVGHGQTIRTEDVDLLAEKFNIEYSVKPKCRQLQESVFSFFTQVKIQIQQSIDIVCKGMVNKIGYPFLSRLNHLSSYKRIKNKEYKALTPKELKKLNADCRGLDMESVTAREKELYMEEIVQNFSVIEGMERLMREYENLAKKLCKNFRHDTSAYKKIEDLKKYLNTILKFNKMDQNCLSENGSRMRQKIQQTNPSNEGQFSRLKSSLEDKQTKQSQQSQNASTINNQSFTKLEAQSNSSRTKYRHSTNQLIEKQVKVNDFNPEYQIIITPEQLNTYESKEKEIFERKEKLMKMMGMKKKSLGKVGENSKDHINPFELNCNQTKFIHLPQLKYQKNFNETQNDKPKRSSNQSTLSKTQISKKPFETSSFIPNQLQLLTPKKNQLSKNNHLTSPRPSKQSNSVRSLNDELAPQKQSPTNQEDQEDKYKYGMVRLPSSESNSSDADNFFKSYSHSITKIGKNKNNIDESLAIEDSVKHKHKKDRINESTLNKLQLNSSNNAKLQDFFTDEQKSSALYLMALEKHSPQDSIKYLKAALSHCPRNISAAEQLSFVYLSFNKVKQCLDLCTEYIVLLTKLSKPDLKSHFITNKSAALNSLGRYSESIMLLQSELVYFDEPKMYKNLADAYYFVGINEKCQYNYEKAIKLNPALDEAMYNLAACIFTQGNFFNADIWISKALSIDPKNIDYQALKKEVQNRLADVQKQSQE